MAAAPEMIEQRQQENVQYATTMVPPTAGFHPSMMQPPVILPAGAQVPTARGAPTMASAMQPPDMSMAQWVSFQGGMQMMVPVQMMGMMQGGMQPGMQMMPEMVQQAEQNGLPPGAPCMWVPALGTSAKPEKADGGQRVMPHPRPLPRMIAPKYAPPLPPKPMAQQYVQSGSLGHTVAEVKAVRPVARPGTAGISKPAPAKGGPRGAKGINMKWRTRYVL